MGKGPTLWRARTSLWWPEMNKQQMQFIDKCEVCNAFQTKDQVTDPGQKLGLIFFTRLRNTIWF